MPICPSCGENNPERARFCLACATRLGRAPAPREVRKTVTVLFSDVAGSTQLGERLDPESLRRVMTRYFDELRSVLDRHGGTVEKFIGDAVMAVFGVPQVHEDDAVRAVRAADEMRDVVEALNKELERDFGVAITNRTGVNTGPVVAGDPASGQTLVTGDTVNVAARLEQAAPHGEILIGETTYRLVRDAVDAEPVEPLALKGKSEPVPAFRLLRVVPGAEGHARRLDAPMVGRARERSLLEQAFERVVLERACHLFTVMGPAGVGKSRLTSEFLIGIGDRATVLRGRCLPYGEGITFWPLAEALTQALGVSELDPPDHVRQRIGQIVGPGERTPVVVERIAQVLGLDAGGGAVLEIYWAVRKVLEALAGEHPLVVVFDDINWGETAFLDLIDYLAEWSGEAPVLLLCLARPDLLEARPGWGGGKPNATSILLEPLTDRECGEMVSNLLGAAGIPEAAEARIFGAAEGNPLFVEEMLGMLIDDGLLIHEDGRWIASGDLSKVSVPPTIEALLAARLDRLDEVERAVIERAAVVGKLFYSDAIRELAIPVLLGTDVDRALLALSRKELIRPARSDLGGDDAFGFRHILIRDAAYQAMPKELRSELHERFASWLEGRSSDRSADAEEIVGYHLEQAFRYREELGPLGERDRVLGGRASERLAAAARRARSRGDVWAVVNLLGRAATLAPESPGRVELLVSLGDVQRELGDVRGAERTLEQAIRLAQSAGDESGQTQATIAKFGMQLSANPEGAPTADEAIATSERAIEFFGRAGDHRGLARALLLLGDVLCLRFQNAEGLEASERALEEAVHGEEELVVSAARRQIVYALIDSPTPVDGCLARLEELLGEVAGMPTEEAALVRAIAWVTAMAGRFDDARALLERRWAMLEEMGVGVAPSGIVGQAETRGWVELMAGDPIAAERALRPGYEELRRLGERGVLSTFAAQLARVVLLQGRADEALALTRESEELAAPEDLLSQVLWRGVRAQASAAEGRCDEAEELASTSVRLSLETDGPNLQGIASMDRAIVLQTCGSQDDPAAAGREALRLFEMKGNVAMASQVERLLAELSV